MAINVSNDHFKGMSNSMYFKRGFLDFCPIRGLEACVMLDAGNGSWMHESLEAIERDTSDWDGEAIYMKLDLVDAAKEQIGDTGYNISLRHLLLDALAALGEETDNEGVTIVDDYIWNKLTYELFLNGIHGDTFEPNPLKAEIKRYQERSGFNFLRYVDAADKHWAEHHATRMSLSLRKVTGTKFGELFELWLDELFDDFHVYVWRAMWKDVLVAFSKDEEDKDKRDWEKAALGVSK